MPTESKETDFVFTPEERLVIPPGSWRLALTSAASEDEMQWLVGAKPRGSLGVVTHLRQAFGKGEPVAAWTYGRGNQWKFRGAIGLYSVNGRWS